MNVRPSDLGLLDFFVCEHLLLLQLDFKKKGRGSDIFFFPLCDL